jgi:hypothetical protein
MTERTRDLCNVAETTGDIARAGSPRVATLRGALLSELGAAIQHLGEGLEDLSHLRRLVGKQLG